MRVERGEELRHARVSARRVVVQREDGPADVDHPREVVWPVCGDDVDCDAAYGGGNW